jgi:glycosyltransferase involved in cell wall biosynthesis
MSGIDIAQLSKTVRPTPAGRWMSVVSHLDPRYGGLSAVVPQLCSSVARTGKYTMELAAFCAPDELFADSSDPEVIQSTWPTSRTRWWRDSELRDRFERHARKADGLHIHGIWEQSTAIAAQTARKMKTPYIVSAHGMLETWALQNKKLKKQIYSALIERTNLQSAFCVHALTNAEAQDYQRYGVKKPIAVIPNGVNIPDSVDPKSFLNRYPNLEGKRVILFMGRIHFKKGLDILVKSWAGLAKEFPDAHLVLAGPDFENTRASIEKLVYENRIESQVLFTGMLRNEIKWSALAHAECFVLPSYSEGLSVSVLEAMGVGLPVILTHQCNLPEVAEIGAGWLITSESGAITSSLRELLLNSPTENATVGSRGCQLVRERYSWSAVTSQMVELYRWVTGGEIPTNLNLVTS